MDKVVDLLNRQQSKKKSVEELSRYVDEAIEINKDKIAYTIENGNEPPLYIVNTYVDYLLSHAFANFSKEKILNYISSGAMQKVHDLLYEGFINDPIIIEAFEYRLETSGSQALKVVIKM